MSGLAGQAIGLDEQSPTPIGGPAAIDAESKGSMENFIGFGSGATSYDPAPVDFDAADDTVTSAADGTTRYAPEYTDSQLMWGGGGMGVLVPAPDGFPAVPFGANFFKQGSNFTTDFVPTSSINEGDPGVTTVYVDVVTGVDSNPGTEALPFKSVYGAVSVKDYTSAPKLIVKIKAGTYGVHENLNDKLPENLNLSCVPWGTGDIIFSNEIPDRVWTLVSGAMWSCPVGGFSFAEYGSTVWDDAFPDAWGDYSALTPVNDAVTCEATPGSYFVDTPGVSVYVHTQDGRQPDSDIHVFQAWNAPGQYGSYGSLVFDLFGYFEGITFLGGQFAFGVTQSNSGVRTQIQFKDCTFKYARGSGSAYVLGPVDGAFDSCVCSSNHQDNITYQAYGSLPPPTGLEVGVESRMSGVINTGTSDQGSTMHDGGTVVRLNGNYHHNLSDQTADVGDSFVWNIACLCSDGRTPNQSGFRSGNGVGAVMAWFESCESSGNTYGIWCDSPANVFTRDFTSDAPNTGTGTITPY